MVHKIKELDKISTRLAGLLFPPADGLCMSIIIPAKDEADGIVKTLQAIANQKSWDGTAFQKSKYEVLLLCHNCSDDTFLKARSFAKAHPLVNIQLLELDGMIADNVGCARRVLMNIAAERLSMSSSFIISTDADTCPDLNWLENIEYYINENIDLVCGLIEVDASYLNDQARNYLNAKDTYIDLKTRLECTLYPNLTDPWPKHSYHWGPNLAIKKNVYQAIGGIQPIKFLEDVDMYNRVISQGYSVRHCIKTKVTTSTRIDARCAEGFGAELRVWTEYEGVPYKVEGLTKLQVRFKIYGLVNQYFKTENATLLYKICELACISENDFLKMHSQSPICEALVVKIESHLNCSESWNCILPNIDVADAVDELKEYLEITKKDFVYK